MPLASHLDPKIDILDDVTGCELRGRHQRPWYRHARAHQLACARHPLHSQRPYEILHPHREFQYAKAQSGTGFRCHQRRHLHGVARGMADPGDLVDPTLGNEAIRVDDQHDIRRIGTQMIHPERERVALATQTGIVTLDHLGTRGTCQRGGVVGAVVGDKHQPIARPQLLQQAFDGWQRVRGFVMRRHEHDHAGSDIRTRDRYRRRIHLPTCAQRGNSDHQQIKTRQCHRQGDQDKDCGNQKTLPFSTNLMIRPLLSQCTSMSVQ